MSSGETMEDKGEAVKKGEEIIEQLKKDLDKLVEDSLKPGASRP